MDKAKKKRLKRYVTWGGIALLVALLTVMPLLAKREAAADGPVASVLSAQVTAGDISQVLRGGGTLKNKGEQDINIPTGVKITEFLVDNDDTVKEGDPVARVDKVSVMDTIAQVAETMEYLREELEKGRDEKVDSSIVATAGGRVKAVFAQKGQSVQDVMAAEGALALLSIDSLMAVKLETTSPAVTGESVTVALSDGSEVIGRVESNLSGQVVVTVEDEGYAIGEKVTVTREDGSSLGSGELYVHNAWKAVGYSGTINAVQAKPEQVLSSGATLFTLTDTDYEGQLRHRASQHREYEQLLQRLLAMYESGYITAPCDGTISGVDKDSAHLLAAEEVDAEVKLLGGNGGWGNVRLMLLSGGGTQAGGEGTQQTCTESADCPLDSGHTPNCIKGCTMVNGCPNSANAHKPGCYQLCAGEAGTSPDLCPNGSSGNHKDSCIYSCSGNGTTSSPCSGTKNHYLSCIGSCDSASSASDSCDATGAHKNSCIKSCNRADVSGACRSGPHYIDCIGSCTEGKDCPATKHKSTCQIYGMTYTATVAKVYSVGNGALVVFWDASGTAYPVQKTGSGWTITGGQFNEALLVNSGTMSAGNAQQFKPGDIILWVKGQKGTEITDLGAVLYRSAASGGGGMPGFVMPSFDLSALMGAFAGFGNYSGMAAAETENLYDLEGSTLMTVTPNEGVEVVIEVDERDIDKVQEGMKATIKLEAVRNVIAEGAVTRVGAIGEHGGSTGKFQVWVEADPIPGSVSGMSSMVTIHQGIRENVLTLPVAAVSQDKTKTIVFTALDKKTGQPAAPVEITTGVSDGEIVEVFGLEKGDQVYYLHYDVLEIDHTAEERQFNLN